jgi:hypothetical protein
MYTSHIGKCFVQLSNEQKHTRLSAQEYFDTAFFPLFYDHAEYLYSPANTPLFQVITQKKTHEAAARANAKQQLAQKISTFATSQTAPDMSFAIGYASADDLGTTSAQVTSLHLPLEAEDMYAAWIGAGFGIGVGKYSILFDKPEILSAIAEGWVLFREYVNERAELANKIDTWNSLWLKHRFSKYFVPNMPRAGFTDMLASEMKRPNWIMLLRTLTERFPNEILTGYVYGFGQTNTTVGFVRFVLPEMSQFWTALFGDGSIEQETRLEKLFTTQFDIARAVERFGVIGLRALEPRDLEKFMPNGRNDLPKIKSDENSQFIFTIYQTWIKAMLNDQEQFELAEKVANALYAYLQGASRGKTDRLRQVEELVKQRGREAFLAKWSELIETSKDEGLSELGKELLVVLVQKKRIALDVIPLFFTSIRLLLANHLYAKK